MGSTYEFKCESCSYMAEVSGGDDLGMGCATTTVSCKQCKELYDVVTTNEPWLVSEPDFKPNELICPESKNHEVNAWKDGDSCPVCGGSMKAGGPMTMWD